MDTFDLVSKERVNTLRPACRSCQQSSGCWAPSTRSGYWDLRPPSGARQVCQVLARTREPRKRRSGRLSAPVAGTPNNGRAAVRRAPLTHQPLLGPLRRPLVRHGLPPTHTTQSRR
eukprot:scaffold24058_cov61-Phaeocystis_antarctica.AAC.1